MYDANAALQTLVTKTATFQPTTGLNTSTGSPLRGWKVRFRVTAANVATVGTAAGTFYPTVDVSTDNTTFRVAATGKTRTMTTAATTYLETIPVGEFPAEPYIRFSVVYTANASTTPSVAYAADLGDVRASSEA